MRKEWILTDEEKRLKRRKIERNRLIKQQAQSAGSRQNHADDAYPGLHGNVPSSSSSSSAAEVRRRAQSVARTNACHVFVASIGELRAFLVSEAVRRASSAHAHHLHVPSSRPAALRTATMPAGSAIQWLPDDLPAVPSAAQVRAPQRAHRANRGHGRQAAAREGSDSRSDADDDLASPLLLLVDTGVSTIDRLGEEVHSNQKHARRLHVPRRAHVQSRERHVRRSSHRCVVLPSP